MPDARPPASPPSPSTRRPSVRSLKAAARQGLQQALRLLTEDDEAEFRGLRDDLVARYEPTDHVELHWIEEMAFTAWRQNRLRAIEMRALSFDAQPDPARPDAVDPIMMLDELVRYGNQLERDWRTARVRLDGLRRHRPPGARPLAMAQAARLRWLADRMDEEAAVAAAKAARPATPMALPPPRAEPARPSATVIPFDPARRRRPAREADGGGGEGGSAA